MTGLINYSEALPFILAGKALFTLRNKETLNRFTYRVDKKKDISFVKLLTGADNTQCYSYIGFIRNNEFVYGVKSRISMAALGVQAFEYVFNKLLSQGKQNPKLEIWHEGKCGKCGRTLTVPESIKSGFGPECIKTI